MALVQVWLAVRLLIMGLLTFLQFSTKSNPVSLAFDKYFLEINLNKLEIDIQMFPWAGH